MCSVNAYSRRFYPNYWLNIWNYNDIQRSNRLKRLYSDARRYTLTIRPSRKRSWSYTRLHRLRQLHLFKSQNGQLDKFKKTTTRIYWLVRFGFIMVVRLAIALTDINKVPNRTDNITCYCPSVSSIFTMFRPAGIRNYNCRTG